MPRKIDSASIERWHKHRGKRLVFFGFLIFIVGLMDYYQFSRPAILMAAGVLIILFGLFKMMKK